MSRRDRARQRDQAAGRRLSTYGLRTHYVCHRAYWQLFTGALTLREVFPDAGLPNTMVAEDTRVVASKAGYSAAMEFTETEDYYDIWFHVSQALEREDLLSMGPMGDGAFLAESLRARSGDTETYTIGDHGFVYNATAAGGELFLWGLGQGGSTVSVDLALARGDLDLDVVLPGIPDSGGFQRVSDLTTAEHDRRGGRRQSSQADL